MTLGGFFLTGLGSLLALGFGFLIARATGQRELASGLVAGLLAAFAQIVLLTELLSLFDAFTATWMLAGMAITTLIAFAALYGLDKARLAPRRPHLRVRGLPTRVYKFVREHPSSASVVAAVVVILSVELYLVFSVAPNTWDSMTYHLARAAYWIQFKTVAQFANATDRQAAFPINAEVLQAWALMLARGDRSVGLIQWISQLGLIAFLFAAARDLRFSSREALFATGLFVAIPVVIAQATSTQNDLLLAFLIAAAMLFLVRGARGGSPGDLLLGAVAVGLAAGSKSTALLALPVFAIVVFFVARPHWRRIVLTGTAGVVAIVLLASFNYAQNVANRDYLIAAPSLDVFKVQSPRLVPVNTARVLWSSFVNSPDLQSGTFDAALLRVTRRALGGRMERSTGGPFGEFSLGVSHVTTEDKVGIGLVGLFAFLPCLLIGLTRFRDRRGLVWALGSAALMLGACATLLNAPWSARFLLPAVAVGAPLMARLGRREGTRVFTVVLIAVSSFVMTFGNGNKQMVMRPTVPSLGRAEQMALIASDQAAVIHAVDDSVAADARIGRIGVENSWDYPFFGPHLRRTVLRLRLKDLNSSIWPKYDLDAVLVDGIKNPPVGMKGREVAADEFLILAPRGARGRG